MAAMPRQSSLPPGPSTPVCISSSAHRRSTSSISWVECGALREGLHVRALPMTPSSSLRRRRTYRRFSAIEIASPGRGRQTSRAAGRRALGDRHLGRGAHMRQRKLLLPPFHGERCGAGRRGSRRSPPRSSIVCRPASGSPCGRQCSGSPSSVICRLVFGIEDRAKMAEFNAAMKRLYRPAARADALLPLHVQARRPVQPQPHLLLAARSGRPADLRRDRPTARRP